MYFREIRPHEYLVIYSQGARPHEIGEQTLINKPGHPHNERFEFASAPPKQQDEPYNEWWSKLYHIFCTRQNESENESATLKTPSELLQMKKPQAQDQSPEAQFSPTHDPSDSEDNESILSAEIKYAFESPSRHSFVQSPSPILTDSSTPTPTSASPSGLYAQIPIATDKDNALGSSPSERAVLKEMNP